MSAAVTRALPPTVWSDLEDALDALIDTEDELPRFEDNDPIMVRIHDGLVQLRVILGAAEAAARHDSRTLHRLVNDIVAAREPDILF